MSAKWNSCSISTRSLRAFCLLLFLACCASSFAREVHLTILHTNDFHAHLLPEQKQGGLATISKYIKTVKATEKAVLILDAGDMITGTPVSTLFMGTPIFEIYNTIPYDAVVLGNHEFDHGWSQVAEFVKVANYPILSANIRTPSGELISGQATHIARAGALNIGIIGITTPRLHELTLEKGWKGLRIQQPAEAVQRYIERLGPVCDLIVVLSHQGYPEDVALAKKCGGIDLIVGGHSHTELTEPKRIGETLIVQAGSNGKWIGRLDLLVDKETDRIAGYRGELIPVKLETIGTDTETQRAVDKWEERVSELVDVKIGTNKTDLFEAELRRIVSEIYCWTFQTDYGFQNLGGIRTNLPAGPITKRDVWSMLPFGNHMVIISLRPEQLIELEMFSAGEIEENTSKQQVSLCTNNYVAENIVRELDLEPDKLRHLRNRIDRDVVIEWIEKHGGFELAVERKEEVNSGVY